VFIVSRLLDAAMLCAVFPTEDTIFHTPKFGVMARSTQTPSQGKALAKKIAYS
jgi:hypothetical protein